MASKKFEIPNEDQVEKLFSTVDDTGHSNEEKAAKQRTHRMKKGTPRDVDPLSETNPAGSDIEKLIRRTAMIFVLITLAVVVVAQVSCGVARRAATANLSQEVSYETVFQALEGGVEWGDGFTQFPDDFKVLEANERTHRVEVEVINTDTDNEMDCFAASNIQATAFSINALLNPEIDTVVYHVDVHQSEKGEPQRSQVFGFLKPTGDVKRFMTFVWSKHATESGVNFTSSITGVEPNLMNKLKDRVSMSVTENLFGVTESSLYDNKTEHVADNSQVGNIVSGLNYTKKFNYSSFEVVTDEKEGTNTLKVVLEPKEAYKDVDFTKQAAMTFALIDDLDDIDYINKDSGSIILEYGRKNLDEILKAKSEDETTIETISSSQENFEDFKNNF